MQLPAPTPQDRYIDIGFQMHVRAWEPAASPAPAFVLVHGLSSNASTWNMTARLLAAAGHPVYAIDQRGHGLSAKPDTGYDFDTITTDLTRLLDALGLERPILAGQSWGGNVLLAFGARFPGRASRLAWVDGGFITLSARGPWETVSKLLAPSEMDGMARSTLQAILQKSHPEWTAEAVEVTLANFETQPDGTIRRQLSMDNHMRILRALYDHQPIPLYPALQEPVLLCIAGAEESQEAGKQTRIGHARDLIPDLRMVWFPHTDHDIHVHRPAELAQAFLAFAAGANP